MSETNGKRRKWSAAEKLRIVLAGLQADTKVSELCRREGITANRYYQWKDRLLGSAAKIYESKAEEPSVQQERSEAQLKRLKDVIAEITAENLELKNALGLEDHGQLPAELQRQVHSVVEQAQERSQWPVRRTLRALGISPTSYYRWLRREAWTQDVKAGAAIRVVQAYEALPEEKQMVRDYACRHTELRHRELAWRMVDEAVAYLSPSTVYRILREENLVCPWRRRKKRSREDSEQATRPNARWGTDLMHLRIGAGQYYLVTFLDEYSRYVVHWELLSGMDGMSVSLAAQAALDTLGKTSEGKITAQPEIRSDNGSCYISRDFRTVLELNGLTHQRIKPHCPEENGLVERSNRTLREALEEVELGNRQQAEEALTNIIRWYNAERLHSALGYLRPIDYYRGQPDVLHEARRTKLSQARHRRRERNLKLNQPTLPLEADHPTP